jgi:hypothetical protein
MKRATEHVQGMIWVSDHEEPFITLFFFFYAKKDVCRVVVGGWGQEGEKEL